MNTTTFSRVRWIRIFEIWASRYFFLTYRRIFWSSTSNSEKSALVAYQVLSQSTMIPVRKPVGRTFCPICQPAPRGLGLLFGLLFFHAIPQDDVDVREAFLD